jgi:tetratricopeptide (TPR) repeat protein
VCGPAGEIGMDVVTGLDDLADQSLLRRIPDLEESRLLMLQTIREFGTERLAEGGEEEVIRERHATVFAAMAEEAQGRLFGDRRKAELDRLELDHDNFRAGLEWCISSGRTELALRLAAAMWRFWQMRGHLREGRARLESVLALPAVRDHPDELRRALEAAGGIAYWQADMAAAQAWYDECLALTRTTGDKRLIANAVYNDSFPLVVGRTADLRKALPLFDEALTLYRELDDQPGIARCLWGIGNVHQFGHDYAAAVPPLDESIELFRKLGDRFGLGWALHTRAVVAINTDDGATAEPLVVEALGLFSKAGDISGITILLDDGAQVARLSGQRLRSLRLAGAAAALQAKSGTDLATMANAISGRPDASAANQEEGAAWAEGHAMTADEAVAYALKPESEPTERR